jgi:uncharacterized membrane protein
MGSSRSKNAADFFNAEESASIVASIEAAERRTSGEIRVHLETKCPGGDPYIRGRDIFEDLGMTATAERNGVLLYLATADRLFAVLGDRGIHERVDEGFWDAVASRMTVRFREEDYAGGLIEAIQEIGERLTTQFPYAGDENDVDELSNEISLGNGVKDDR